MYGREEGGGRATNEDLTFRAAGGDGIGPRLPVRVRPCVRLPVGLSHVKTSGRARGGERDHETNKFLANCHRRTEGGGRGREGERPFGNKEREDDFGHRRDGRAAEVFELSKNEGERERSWECRKEER